MPEFEDEFKFPDEVENSAEGDNKDENFEIEIEDDTPEADRGRQPMPKELVEELEKDELDSYDEGVKQRLKQMKKVWHDERREKESATREREEALRFAQSVAEENKRIKSILSTGEKEYVEAMQNSATLQLEMAKRAYKDAYDSGDTDKQIEAQQAMQDANIKMLQIKNFRLPSLQNDGFDVQSQYQEQYQQNPTKQADPKLNAWLSRNTWYGQDDEMTAAALGLHNKLAKSGVTVGSNEYYSTLDKTMRKRFSEYFEDQFDEASEKVEKAPTKPSTVVAPATRSTASNKIKLKASQVQLAKKLGLTVEQYAKAVKNLETQNG